MQVSVIIVSYNVLPFLQLCLYTLKLALKNIPSEIIVVDNNSSDGSAGWLEQQKDLKLLLLNKNLGFGAANNQALKQVSGKYTLFLNPDTITDAAAIQAAIQELDKNEKLGASGIRMIDGCGCYLPESKRGKPSALASFYRFSGFAKLFSASKHFAAYYQGHLHSRVNAPVPVLAGAFLMARTELLKKLGGFDEQFFMYAEDIDLSYRLLKTGYRNYYIGQKTIIHFKGESSQMHKQQYVAMFYKSMQQFVAKHYKTGIIAKSKGIVLHKSIQLTAAISRLKHSIRNKKADKLMQASQLNLFVSDQHFLYKIPDTVMLNSKKLELKKTNADAPHWLFVLNDAFNIESLENQMTLAGSYKTFWFTYPDADFMLSSSNSTSSGIVARFNQ